LLACRFVFTLPDVATTSRRRKPPATRRLVNFRCPVDLYAAMKAVTAREGIPASRQITMALTAWLAKRPTRRH
jgi:hypothetical protein